MGRRVVDVARLALHTVSDLWLPRRLELEVELTRTAAMAGGVPLATADALSAYASRRAFAGPVRQRDMHLETFQEIGDARNYLTWDIPPIWDAFVAGESAAGARYEQTMRGLMRITQAFHELTTVDR